jgi:hypothetical protein
MQFIPSSWKRYGVDANQDGKKDPYNPVDAIFAAARYLKAAGGDKDLRKAIFSYNHADWYVNSVLHRARLLAALPSEFVSALSGLAQGRPPVIGRWRVARRGPGDSRRTRSIVTRPGAAVVAVTDGVVERIGHNRRLGRFVRLRDVYGNTYTYGELATVAGRYPVLKPAALHASRSVPATTDAAPHAPASAGTQRARARPPSRPPGASLGLLDRQAARWTATREAAKRRAARHARSSAPLTGYDRRLLGTGSQRKIRYHALREGSRVVAGTILARAAAPADHGDIRFEIRPTGRHAPRIDPQPILAGWKLLRAAGPSTRAPSIGQLLLLGKRALDRYVLDDRRVGIYGCGRDDIRAGRIDRRVLITLELLATSGLDPTVSALRCGHSRLTSSGNVSEHISGNAVDISAINGVPILGHQGAGSLTEAAIQRILGLQGPLAPHQIISLMTFAGADNTLALPDHDDHIHVGFAPDVTSNPLVARSFDGVLDRRQWLRLMKRLSAIENPDVSAIPSHYAVKARRPG